MAERTAQRRFLALKVGEVSLVDSPANEEEFIVLKRRCDPEEQNMADVSKNEPAAPGTTEVTKGNDADNKNAPAVVPVEVQKAADEHTKSALAIVEKMTETIAKMVGATAPAAPATSTEDVQKAKKAKSDAMLKKLQDAGLTGKSLEKAHKAAMDAEDAAEGPEPDASMKKDVKKSADDQASAEEAEVTKTLDAMLDAIQKAKSFTPKREAALKSAVEGLQKLLGELISVPQATMPGNSLPSGATVSPGGLVSVKKELEDLVSTLKASFENVEKAHKEMAGRVEAIEKARNPTQAVTEGGGTDKKVTKSFWSGVL